MRLVVVLIYLISQSAFAQIAVEKVVQGVSTTRSEDSPKLSPDGTQLVFLRSVSEEWPASIYRQAWVTNEGMSITLPLGLDSVYTISLAYDAGSRFCSRRIISAEGDRISFYRASGVPGNWQLTNITERDGISASYAHQVKDGSIYFFQYEGEKGTGLYRSQWNGQQFEAPAWLGDDLSPPGTTTFSPFVSADEDWMFFTAYYEDDGESGRTGFYFARKVAGKWIKQQLPGLPYGWSASIDPASGYFYFTDGEDIYRCHIKDLGIDFDFGQR